MTSEIYRIQFFKLLSQPSFLRSLTGLMIFQCLREILAPPFTVFCRAIKSVISPLRFLGNKQATKKSHIFATMKKTKNRSRQCQPKKKYITSKKSDLDLIILNHIVMELERDEANNNSKLAYGAISMIVARMKPTAPFLTKDMVKYYLWKPNKTGKQRGGAADAQLDLLYPSNTTTTANAPYSP